ncbi:MAG: DUF1559 family PulG-like putative transporter [Phycisphaerales bacterium]
MNLPNLRSSIFDVRSSIADRRSQIAHGFTLVELLVVISIIALLLAILLPALNKARNAARGIQCLSNLKQLSVGLQMYSESYRYLPMVYYLTPSYDGKPVNQIGPFPRQVGNLYAPGDRVTWANLLHYSGILTLDKAYLDPAGGPTAGWFYQSYGVPQSVWGEYNDGNPPLRSWELFKGKQIGVYASDTNHPPAGLVLLTDCTTYWTHYAGSGFDSDTGLPSGSHIIPVFPRHTGSTTSGSLNVVMFDGHAQSISQNEAENNLTLWGK